MIKTVCINDMVHEQFSNRGGVWGGGEMRHYLHCDGALLSAYLPFLHNRIIEIFESMYNAINYNYNNNNNTDDVLNAPCKEFSIFNNFLRKILDTYYTTATRRLYVLVKASIDILFL